MNAEEKKRYFTETALALNREGFRAETIISGTLGVWLDDEPLCEVSEVGGITYRGENISTTERVAAKDKAYEIVSTTAEYAHTPVPSAELLWKQVIAEKRAWLEIYAVCEAVGHAWEETADPENGISDFDCARCGRHYLLDGKGEW